MIEGINDATLSDLMLFSSIDDSQSSLDPEKIILEDDD
jgi:hypothetical protein